MTKKLFESGVIGDLALKNRIVMAPMTRGRADNPGLVPTSLMAQYYGQRAGAGLIVTEGTWINRGSIGYINAPGIYTAEQVEGWRAVTAAVHDKGGKIFSQLAHIGAVSHPDHLDGDLPIGPSAVNPLELTYTPMGFKDTPVPREMTAADIRQTVEDFRRSGQNAKEAGFDGVEIHGAHLYLIPEFLNSTTNVRTDQYGGSSENRSRFVIEIVEALIEVWGPGKVGLKLSPGTSSGLLKPNADTEPTYRFLAGRLNDFPLAYLHVLGTPESLPGTPGAAFEDIAAYFRPLYRGTLIAGGAYTRQSGEALLLHGDADLVAFGAAFIANPDLVDRFRHGHELAAANNDLIYTGGAEGYADYPAYSKAAFGS
jgi:N-ethylmaleimide reductase